MSESLSRRNLVKALQFADAFAVETAKTKIGVPDVNLIGGWIECKWMRQWPVRCMTHPVRFPHDWTQGQRIWAKRRIKRGGIVYLCAQVKRDWFFFSAQTALEWWGNMTRPDMEIMADLHLPNGLDTKILTPWVLETFTESARLSNS